MPKSRAQKEKEVQNLTTLLEQGKAAVFANMQGITVNEIQELKKQGKLQGVSSTMAKKTLLKRVLTSLKIEATPEAFEGSVGVFVGSDEIAAAKLITAYSKKQEKAKIFGGVFNGKLISTDEVNALSKLPGKQDLLGMLVRTLNAPASSFANVLAANLRGMVTVLDAIAKTKTS